jgi:RHS repeat-associated protein
VRPGFNKLRQIRASRSRFWRDVAQAPRIFIGPGQSACVVLGLSGMHARGLNNRYYDPATGQFTSEDPLASETGQLYEYAGDNSINATDPLGQSHWSSVANSTNGISRRSVTW